MTNIRFRIGCSLLLATQIFLTGCTTIPLGDEGEAHVQPVEDQGPKPLGIRADNRRGVYLTAASVAKPEFVRETIDKLKQAGGTVVVIDVKETHVFFKTNAPIANEVQQVYPLYELPSIVEELHAEGLYVIARFVALKDAGFAKKVPEAQLRHSKTGEPFDSIWVDGSHPVTLEYNRQVMREVVKAGVDEVNIDYIRYPTEYSQSLIDLTGAEKAQRVLQFVKMARDVIDDVNPDVQLGLSTYAILGWDYDYNLEAIGQDVVLFAPYVDIISPMAYPQTFPASFYNPARHHGTREYYLVYKTLVGYADQLGPEHELKIRPWIQGYGLSPEEIHQEIMAVMDAGYCGYTVWSAGNVYAPTYGAMTMETDWPERCDGTEPLVMPGAETGALVGSGTSL